jgi:RNA polymerase sigma-70 factor (ECF subfamily)
VTERDQSFDLLRRIQAGEADALAALFERHGRMVGRTVRRIVDDGAAEDLIQETFVRVLDRASQWRPEDGSPAQWITGIAKHCALDYVRSAGRLRSARQSAEAACVAPMENEVLESDRARLLQNALQHLTPAQRAVIELAYFQGLSQTDIADKLGEPLGTVKGRTRLALSRLRTIVDISAL